MTVCLCTDTGQRDLSRDVWKSRPGLAVAVSSAVSRHSPSAMGVAFSSLLSHTVNNGEMAGRTFTPRVHAGETFGGASGNNCGRMSLVSSGPARAADAVEPACIRSDEPWRLDGHQRRRHCLVTREQCTRVAHDPGTRVLLRWPDPGEEHPQHDDDVVRHDLHHQYPVGALRVQSRVRRLGSNGLWGHLSWDGLATAATQHSAQKAMRSR